MREIEKERKSQFILKIALAKVVIKIVISYRIL
jgi:hypothetical protein